MEVIEATLYDYPKYYDLLFGSDWKAEFDFLQACFEKHAGRTVRRLFEPACGTGRLLIKFAQAGYEVSGNDLNAKAIAYTPTRQFRLEDQFAFRTYTAAQFRRLLGDVPDLELAETYDFAYDIGQPVQIDAETLDVVYVLRKK